MDEPKRDPPNRRDCGRGVSGRRQTDVGCDARLSEHPLRYLRVALYLKSLRGIEICGAYYGMVEGFARDSKEPRPIVDLRSLLELPEWFHAVACFARPDRQGRWRA